MFKGINNQYDFKKSMEDKDIKKGFNNRDIAFSEPVLSDFPFYLLIDSLFNIFKLFYSSDLPP